MSKARKLLVTGATGFVGRQVCANLLQLGFSLRITCRNLPARIEGNQNIEFVLVDDLFSLKKEQYQSLVKDIDTLVHIAWFTEPGIYLSSPLNMRCLQGTLELAEAFTSEGGRRFIGVGTCFEYDTSFGFLKVTTPLKPDSLYAACKIAAFSALSQYFLATNVEFAWGRLFYLYGEGENEKRLAPYLQGQLQRGVPAHLSHGNQIRDFLDVAQAGSQLTQLAIGNECGAFNICSGIPVTVRQFAESIADVFARRDLLIFGSLPERENDPSVIFGEPHYRTIDFLERKSSERNGFL